MDVREEWADDKFYISFCRCSWRGSRTLTRTAATRQYKLHKRYPKLSKESMAAAAEDLLKTFVMAHTMEMKIDVPEWRATLGVFAEALKYEQQRRKGQPKYIVKVGTRGRGELPFKVKVDFPGYDSSTLDDSSSGNFAFENWVHRHKDPHEYMKNQFRFNKLINAKALAKVSKFLLHLDEKHANFKHEYAKWAGWAVEWREAQLRISKDRFKKAARIAKHKTTWEYLKEKYPTKGDVKQVLAERAFSKSYTALLNRLVKYHEKREA